MLHVDGRLPNGDGGHMEYMVYASWGGERHVYDRQL